LVFSKKIYVRYASFVSGALAEGWQKRYGETRVLQRLVDALLQKLAGAADVRGGELAAISAALADWGVPGAPTAPTDAAAGDEAALVAAAAGDAAPASAGSRKRRVPRITALAAEQHQAMKNELEVVICASVQVRAFSEVPHAREHPRPTWGTDRIVFWGGGASREPGGVRNPPQELDVE
jgi:hypothetical protein